MCTSSLNHAVTHMTEPWPICKTAVVKLVLEGLQGLRIVSIHSYSNTPTGKPATDRSGECGGQSLRTCTVQKYFTCHLHCYLHASYVSILLELAVSIIHIQLWNKWHCQHSTDFWIHCLREEQPNTSLLRQCIARYDLPYSHKIISKAISNRFYRTDIQVTQETKKYSDTYHHHTKTGNVRIM